MTIRLISTSEKGYIVAAMPFEGKGSGELAGNIGSLERLIGLVRTPHGNCPYGLRGLRDPASAG
jgi:hypothetical protein